VKVVLTTTIDPLGHVGEVVDVADGYARNYLLPRKLALQPTEHNIAQYAKEKAEHEALLEEREAQANRLRDALADRTLVFVRKAHDDDKLYGSVRTEEIAEKIEEETGSSVEPARIRLEHPIETTGPHSVTVNLYRDISVELRIRVDAEGEPAEEG
jgi:large subunit ribosomal protein L9